MKTKRKLKIESAENFNSIWLQLIYTQTYTPDRCIVLLYMMTRVKNKFVLLFFFIIV